jgi:hypothetical protein
MLRITSTRRAEGTAVALEGRLTGPWVDTQGATLVASGCMTRALAEEIEGGDRWST